jgi:NAD(P)-dependent dehydrogenase (short-subunit alcohol dehydrogenase family)
VTEQDPPRRHLRLIKPDETASERPAGEASGEQAPQPLRPQFFAPGYFANFFDLSGRVALIAGGGGGIGGAIAQAFADFGARIVIADVDLRAAEATAQACARPSIPAPFAVGLDITNYEMVNEVVAEIEGETGGIDILVNSVGINILRPFTDYTPAEWRRIIDTNLTGVFYVSQAVARGMLARSYGRVITLGSVSSLLGHPFHAPYAATKGGIAIMTKGMATEWAPKGVTVNAIGPAYTITNLVTDYIADPADRARITATIPMGRLGMPEDLVGAAIYLASEAGKFTTGQTIYVDGGRTSD